VRFWSFLYNICNINDYKP